MLTRAWSTLELKAVNDEQRTIEGIASSISTDRMGDVVVPEGASFSLPLPLLWQHKHDQPIGHVTEARVSAKGIRIKAQIAKEGVLPEIDRAWSLIKSGLVRGLSIGFRATEDPEPIKGTFGYKFTAWEWLELSAVTIPANQDASIASIKSIDAEHLAATGERDLQLHKNGEPVGEPVRITTSGVSDKPRAVVKTSSPKRHMKKTTAEQINEYEAMRDEKSDRMAEIMSKAAEENRTLDAAEAEEYDSLKGEVESVDGHVARLKALQKHQVESARPVSAGPAQVVAAPSPVITLHEQTPPGIGFARMAIAEANGFLTRRNALEVAKQFWPSDQKLHAAMHQKETILAGTSVHATNASPLVDQVTFDFLEFLRPQTILGKFGTGNIPSLRSAPFNVRTDQRRKRLLGW
jgi:HK97 family phage prohead protease